MVERERLRLKTRILQGFRTEENTEKFLETPETLEGDFEKGEDKKMIPGQKI
jgi:hypothetical protein